MTHLTVKMSLNELRAFLATQPKSEIQSLIGKFGGPNRAILRYKYFEPDAASKFTYLVSMRLAELEIEDAIAE